MKSPRLLVLGSAAAVVLAACSQGAQGPPTTTSVNPVSTSYGTLQFSVGTANIFGTATGLNIVSTFRQNAGGTPAKSAVLVSTPTITGPFTLPAAQPASGGYDPFSTTTAAGGGPSAQEVAKKSTISGTPSSVRFDEYVCDQVAPCSNSTAANTTTFGLSGGVFANGLQPANNSVNNSGPWTYVPYTQPIWDSSADAFLDWGGPPAYDPDGHGMGVRDGISDLGSSVLGVNEGVTAFEGITAVAGSYTLSLQIPTGVNSSGTSSFGTLTKTATLASTATLPTVAAPVLTPDGKGGGTFAVTLPTGVTEEFIQIVDTGLGSGTSNCQGVLGTKSFPVYYTLVVKASGTVTLPAAIGPNSSSGAGSTVFTPSPTLCTASENSAANGGTTEPADAYTVQVIGVDYPLYEASPLNGSSAPTITGSAGQSDVTISLPVAFVYGSEAATGHVVRRGTPTGVKRKWFNPHS